LADSGVKVGMKTGASMLKVALCSFFDFFDFFFFSLAGCSVAGSFTVSSFFSSGVAMTTASTAIFTFFFLGFLSD
jgi:hypothetical protein